MADEYFFAQTLKGEKASEVWDPETKNNPDEYQGGHKLIIKQAVLGADAVQGEVNVLQVEAVTWKKSIKVPVAVLTAGGPNNQVLLDLSFPDPPVTFSLAQGSGPLHIIGHHLIGSPIEEFDEMDEMEEEMIEDEEGEEEADGIKKRKLETIEENEEEDEDEEEGPKTKKAKTASNSTKSKTPVKNSKAKK